MAFIKESSLQDTSSLAKSFFGVQDPHDKTTVFDYVDDYWVDHIYAEIEKVARSDLYKGDGSREHRIAYITVNINLLHIFQNANKRSSILTLFILLLYNKKLEVLYAHNWNYYYTLAKEIARGGIEEREKRITEMRESLR